MIKTSGKTRANSPWKKKYTLVTLYKNLHLASQDMVIENEAKEDLETKTKNKHDGLSKEPERKAKSNERSTCDRHVPQRGRE